jgi:prepilin signal peptidase PulO-like enzyme (type II secretory pathway)
MPELPAWYFVVFAAALGGAVGSFLNVVVYRLPLGLSLISPPSHCPGCKKPIPWYDNVPVFGWIVLGGRCRNCRAPISMRYPLVEGFTALMFAAVASAWAPQYAAGACVLVLLCTLLCAVLMTIDGNRPPNRLYIPALIVGLAVPLPWPMPRMGTLFVGGGLEAWMVRGLDSLAGAAVGAALGLLASWFFGRRQKIAKRKRRAAEPPWDLAVALACCGLYLGCQAAIVVAIATLLLHVAMLYVATISPRCAWPRMPARAAPAAFVAALAWVLIYCPLLAKTC